ncbi:helix-turn-helix domain-containing protein [candidate division KSB3 bacterium]|nr:helix-turn-helix domain-containing protein [candidate division KSB3 bacterium]
MGTKELAEWINQRLFERDWSQSELARRAGLTPAQISRILSGTRGPSMQSCRAISRAFGEPPENLFRLAGFLPPKPEEEPKLRDVLYRITLLDDEGREELEKYLDYLLSLGHRKDANKTSLT